MLENIRVGFSAFGFYGYPLEVIASRGQEAAGALRSMGIQVTETDPMTSFDDVPCGLEQLSGKEYDAIIACVIAWTETPVITGILRDYLHLPILLWGRGGYTVSGRLVSPAAQAGTSAALDTIRLLGAKYKYIYDYPDSPMSLDKVVDFCQAAKAVNVLAHSRIGMMGYADMGLYSLMFDGLEVRKRLGVEVESYDMLEIEQAMQMLPAEAVRAQIAEWQQSWEFEQPVAPPILERVARLTLALNEKIDQRGYLAASTKCVYGVTKYMGCTACMAQSMLGDKAHFVCENDVPGMITQTMLGLLTGQSTTFLEMYEYFPDRLLTGVCGFTPTSFIDGGKVSVRGHTWGGSSGGIVNTAQMKTGKVTLARISLHGERYRMHILTGEAVKPRDWEELGWAPPAPYFPSLEIIPDGGVEGFAQKALAQHYAVVYGDHRQKLVDLCELLDIEVI
jgi:L-fucose isomerase-like protein